MFESGLLGGLPWVRHGFGTRLSGDWPGEYTQLKQIHSDLVFGADGRTGCVGEGDALISSEPGQLVGIRTADCVPILFADPEHRVVAAAHAGWRGTVAGIARSTVERMRDDYGSDPEKLLAAIGPSIGKCCFEVGPEVAMQFREYFPDAGKLTHIDLPEANYRQLIAAGLPEGNIDRAGLCTMCGADRFHSFRRDGQAAGRMVAAIAGLAPSVPIGNRHAD